MDSKARVLTPAQIYTVDGYDAETKTVYEYHGCYFHGCKKYFPIHRQKHATVSQTGPLKKRTR